MGDARRRDDAHREPHQERARASLLRRSGHAGETFGNADLVITEHRHGQTDHHQGDCDQHELVLQRTPKRLPVNAAISPSAEYMVAMPRR
jgi:hypothetical protein